MAIKGTLSESFLDGQNDCAFAIDWEFLTEEEQDLILNFLLEISHKEHVIGKNKESWLTDERDKIPLTDGYEEESYWHYHCGPSWQHNTFKNWTRCLVFNPGGKSSSECIHYYPVAEDEIIVVGFSRNHIPFMPSDVLDNPFFN
ncbi:TPA: hypothetical protein MCJ79_002482 [Klebsiella pneumoniae]|uniref:hypothetical protein n=1 Tax=Klebsiella pneumoniae TaxID=573 RepID=UPI002A703A1D|nr:hypothetical protein [Klebsiella pneumoniae]HBR2664921.1 hypothetical protein [Klebsiella pneumoniae]HBT7833269.1 hypothetical protein [Klebsiella pneumoniae]HEK8300592.1 hypothetical protein [Klebsiella pneumoniae]